MPLWQALGLVAVVSFFAGARWPAAAAAALLANWWACSEFSALYAPEGDAYMALAAIDLMTAFVILALPGGRMQALLSLTYAISLTMHAAYGYYSWGHGRTAWGLYYYLGVGLHWVAWSQLWLVATWAGGDFIGRIAGDRGHIGGDLDTHGSLSAQALRADRKGGE